MAISWKPFISGQAISAQTMNDTFGELESGVNKIDESYLQRESLTRDHLPTLVHASDYASIGGVDHNYYSDGSPYPGDDAALGSSWTKVNASGEGGPSADDLKLDFNDLQMQQTSGENGVAGVMIMFNAQCTKLQAYTGSTAVSSGYHDIYAIFRIITEDDSGGLWAVRTAERFIDGEAKITSAIGASDQVAAWKDISIRTLLYSTDLYNQYTKLRRVYVGVSVITGTYTAGAHCMLRQASLCGFALQAGQHTVI